MTVAEMKKDMRPNEDSIKDLKQEINIWEEAASADEKTDKKIKFTGKCILV
jgi:hypothetical protein